MIKANFLSLLKQIKSVWPKSIRYQLILGIALVHLVLLTIVVVDQLIRQKKFLKRQNYEQALSLVNDFAVNSSSYILANDIDGLERLVQSHKNFPNLKYAMFLSPDGLVLAHTNRSFMGLRPTDSVSLRLKDTPHAQTLLENKDILDIAVPVIYNNKEIIGWVRIGLGQDYIYSNQRAIIRNGILYIIMALVIGTLFAIFIANRLSRGLYRLILTADKIRKGDRNTRVEPFRSIEISKLGMAFNQMLDEISANEKLLQMVLENMPVGVWLLNEKGDIISANSASEKIWSGLKFVGLKDFGQFKGWFTDTGKIVEPDQWGGAIAILKGETVLNQEIEIECFDKTRKIILNSAIPLKGDNGGIIGAIAINVDITDKKLIEKNLYKINYEMGERVKELRCLYKMSELANDPDKTMEDILEESINIIPLSYQYPDITCVRITFHGLIPNKIIEVSDALVESFLGRIYDPADAQTSVDGLKIFSDPSFRILLVTKVTDPILLRHRLGGERADDLLDLHNHIVKRNLTLCGGREVEREGNGFIISFSSATKAASCALSILGELSLAAATTIGFKIGLNAGEPIEKGKTLFGDTIQLASYLCEIVSEHRIAITNSIKDLISKDHLQNRGSQFFSLSPQDESLLELLFSKLEENWQDAEFNIPDYCQATAMSKSQLYRKTIMLTGLSPNSLLREFRLEKAKESMKKQRYTIAQITFDSGFTSASYFTKCFKKKYGLLPMAYLDLLH